MSLPTISGLEPFFFAKLLLSSAHMGQARCNYFDGDAHREAAAKLRNAKLGTLACFVYAELIADLRKLCANACRHSSDNTSVTLALP